MKYAPKKVFILSGNNYREISYEELCRLLENKNSPYAEKFFIPLHGMLMEVTYSVYKDFYKDKRHQKYLYEQSKKNKDISEDMFTTDAFKGEDILIDRNEDVATQVENKIMQDKLHRALLLLTEDEQNLMRLHFFENMSQIEIAKSCGLNQSNISRRIGKILSKLKNLMEN